MSLCCRFFCRIVGLQILANSWQRNATHHNTTQHNTTQKRTLTNRGDNIPLTFSMYFFKSLSRNSKTRYNLPSLWTQSLSSTILSCLSSLSRLISLSAVDGIPSSSTSSRILLRATISLFVLSRACKQRHKSPHPSWAAQAFRSSGICVVERVVRIIILIFTPWGDK